MIAFKKPKKNFRKKATSDDHEEDQVANEAKFNESNNGIKGVSTSMISEKPKEKQKIVKSSSKGLLSFEDELEEGEEFVLKKSRESRKLSQKLKEQKKKKKETVGVIEEEKELSVPKFKIGSIDEDAVDSPGSYNRDTNSDSDEDDDDDQNSGFQNIHSGLSTGVIPDAATIFAMKKQRERARQLGTGADFVPIETSSTVKYQGRFSSSKSRLVREEDEDSDEERIEFKGTQKKSFPALERRKEVAKALEEAHDDIGTEKDTAEELNIWEQEQIKKGASIPASLNEQAFGPAAPTLENDMKTMDLNVQPIIPFSAGSTITYGFPVQSMPSVMPQGMQNVTVEMVSNRIKERLDSIQQVHRAHVLEAEKYRNDVANYKKSTISLESKLADVSDRFKFYQEISGYVQDLIDCLNEKVPVINDLESSMLQLWKQRAHKFHQRRLDDIKDEDSQISGKAQVKVTSSNSTDEFGRDRGKYEETARQRRAAEREGRRNRRRKQRSSASTHHEGMSSDDEELDSEVNKFKTDKERLLKQREVIFEDVIPEFSSLDEIKSHFEEWKFGFSDSYKEAYIHLCLPKLFSPFWRLEMLEWNPLQIDCKDFEETDWFRVLAMYGHVAGDKTIDKEDSNLIPLVNEKVLLPRLIDLVKFVWDPLSKTQTKLLILHVQRLVDDYPTLQKQSKNTENLFTEIVKKIRNTIDSEIYIPLFSKGLLENKSSGASAFLERQFWSGFKLYGNIMQWKELLSLKTLQELGVDSCLNRYLIVALQQMTNTSERLEKCKDIIAILPKALFDGSDNVPSCLQSLARYINSLAGQIFKSSLGYSDQEKRKAKLMIKKCISLLMHLQAFDVARSAAKDFKIDIAQEKNT
ncbi:PAX3- and PAX7-binding protein 1-like isoform X2 [Rhopilema esculentum]|uniref:PAX3- and PAX7-binding protein 1-like isoform X2 n=1 Tax=Rhopilema esculentum TaxID=499914 RepID=UPI0031D4A4A6